VGVGAGWSARPGVVRAVAAAVVLVAGAGLGALRLTPGDDGSDDVAFDVVDDSPAPSTTVVEPGTSTTAPPVTLPATTAAPVTNPGQPRAPLSPLPNPSPATTAPRATTTAPPPPPTTARPNRPPVAVADQGQVRNGSASVPVLNNDHDPDGNLNRGSVVVVSGPEHGNVAVNDGVIDYIADSSYEGSDQLRYRVCDTAGACAQANVTLSGQ
jgi:hypothetical protein